MAPRQYNSVDPDLEIAYHNDKKHPKRNRPNTGHWNNRANAVSTLATLVASWVMHLPGLIAGAEFGSWIDYGSLFVGAAGEGVCLLLVLTWAAITGYQALHQLPRARGWLRWQALSTAMAALLIILLLSTTIVSFTLADATFRSMSGGVGPTLWIVVAGIQDARAHAEAQFRANPRLAKRRIIIMLSCYIGSLVVHGLGQVYRYWSHNGQRPLQPPSNQTLTTATMFAIGLYILDFYCPVLHAYLSLLGSFYFTQEYVVFCGHVDDKHSELARTRPNVIYLWHESLSGSLMLNTEQGRRAMPFFQSLLNKDDFYLFRHGRSVSGDTKDALTSLATGCLPMTEQGRTVAFGRSIGAEFRRLGYYTASFSSRKLDLERTPWFMLHNYLTGGMDLVIDPLSETFPLINGEGSDDRKMLPYFASWMKHVQMEANGTFYAQFYTFNSHWPYVQDRDSKAEHRYFSSLETTDQLLNSIFTALETAGQLNKTIIVGSGDHDEDAMRDRYVRLSALDSHILHMPAYIYYPTGLLADQTERDRLRKNTQHVVSVLDLFPTLQHILYDGDASSTSELRASHAAANLSDDLDHCITGLDLLSVNVPEERVSFGKNYVSQPLANIELWSIAGKDTAMYYRSGPSLKSLEQSTGFYELTFGNCTVEPDAYCLSEFSANAAQQQRWEKMIQWVDSSPLVSDQVKQSDLVQAFRDID